MAERNYKFELVPLKEERVVKSTDSYTLMKVAFLAEPSAKNADGTKTNGNIIGDALEFRNVEEQPAPKVEPKGYTGEVSDFDNIPF